MNIYKTGNAVIYMFLLTEYFKTNKKTASAHRGLLVNGIYNS